MVVEGSAVVPCRRNGTTPWGGGVMAWVVIVMAQSYGCSLTTAEGNHEATTVSKYNDYDFGRGGDLQRFAFECK